MASTGTALLFTLYEKKCDKIQFEQKEHICFILDSKWPDPRLLYSVLPSAADTYLPD
jgi:hypothetical protein